MNPEQPQPMNPTPRPLPAGDDLFPGGIPATPPRSARPGRSRDSRGARQQGQGARPNAPRPVGADGQPISQAGVAGGNPRSAGTGAGRPARGGGSGGSKGGRGRNGQRPKPLPTGREIPVNKTIFNGAAGAQQTQIKERSAVANTFTKQPKLRIIPLGGLGEIGKNMMAVEYEQDIVIIDMGFAFPDESQPGIDYIIPDTEYLEKNKHKIRGIVITHGHMDHIGAAGYMIPKFPVPIYGSRLSLAFVEKQIAEFKIHQPKWMVLDPDKHERVQLGAFSLELVRVTHTISDSTAAVLRTPIGTIINTGDWRHDTQPLDNKPMDFARLEEIGKEGVLLLMSDSTSCDRAGHNPYERDLTATIDDLFGRAAGRIIISAFSSSITRVQLIIDATAKAKRKLALVGRSTLANVELCVKLGYIKIPPGLLMRVQDITRQPDNQVVILSTGSQGEENSALVRMSTGDHQNVKIKPGDTIIFSSSVIPGNEVSVVRLIDNLMREGANVFAGSTQGIKHHGPVHVGGHAWREDVGELVALVKPKYYMPIHGEFHHLVYSAEVAVENGVAPSNAFVLDNGDVLEITPSGARRGERVPSGIVLIDGSGVGDVEQIVLRDRLTMSGDGIFMIIATVDRKTGKLLTSPDIISRGFIYMKDNEELIGKARAEIRKAFENRSTREPDDWAKFKLRLRDDIGDLLYRRTKRSPMIIPVINEV